MKVIDWKEFDWLLTDEMLSQLHEVEVESVEKKRKEVGFESPWKGWRWEEVIFVSWLDGRWTRKGPINLMEVLPKSPVQISRARAKVLIEHVLRANQRWEKSVVNNHLPIVDNLLTSGVSVKRRTRRKSLQETRLRRKR